MFWNTVWFRLKQYAKWGAPWPKLTDFEAGIASICSVFIAVFKGFEILDNLYIFGQTAVIVVIIVNSSEEYWLIVMEIRTMKDLYL